MRYYRAISQEEYDLLQLGATVVSSEYGFIHVLPENVEYRIVPDIYNYKLSIGDIHKLPKPTQSIDPKTLLTEIMIGVVPEDYIIEIETDDVISQGLGYYYWQGREEIVILETHIAPYNMDNIVSITSLS